MGFHLQFRRYRLPLRTTVRTAHEVWTERHGIIIRLEDAEGRVGFGEVAPIPAFGTETVEMAEAALRTLGEWPSEQQLAAVPSHLGCLRRGLAAANPSGEAAARTTEDRSSGADDHSRVTSADDATGRSPYRAVAALLPAGKPALEQLRARSEAGFRIFKWKVGIHDLADEFGWLDELCAELPKGGKLRIDANGSWDRRGAGRWLDRCADRPIEFVEQPCFAPKAQGDAAWQRTEDTLLGLARDYPTPIALDESLVGEADFDRWLAAGWPGWFVLKPSLIGDLPPVIERLSVARATVVFSSALETAVGARSALEVAFRWRGEPKALGFGVWPLFSDARFDGPSAAPFIRLEDVARIDAEAVWNALN